MAWTISCALVALCIPHYLSVLVVGLVSNLSLTANRSSSRTWPFFQFNAFNCWEIGKYYSHSSHCLQLFSFFICTEDLRALRFILWSYNPSFHFALSKDFSGFSLSNKLNTKRPVWDFRASIFWIPSTFLVLTSAILSNSRIPAKPSSFSIPKHTHSFISMPLLYRENSKSILLEFLSRSSDVS